MEKYNTTELTDDQETKRQNKNKQRGADGAFTDPELDQVESVLRAHAEQLLQAALLLGELVVDLPDVDALQHRVAVARVALADVHKQVLVVLKGRINYNCSLKYVFQAADVV